MNKNTAIIAAILIALASAGGYYLWMMNHTAMEMDHGDSHMTQTEQSPQIPQAEQIAALERQFISEMIPHHEEAVVSAQQVIDLGTNNAEVLKLANDIVTAQKAEIDLMKEWHVTWYGEAYKDAGTYEPMMRDAAALSGVERDKAFLEDMIQHHLHALAMVQASAPQFVRPELKELSQNIASSQSNEVVAMKILLRQL
jgi:uncharacterized protein (DUF305 family)